MPNLTRGMAPAAVVASILLISSSARAEDAEALVGSWSWSYKDGQGVTHKHVLEVEGTGEKVAARERMDEEEAIKVTDLKVKDKAVTFTVVRGKRRAAYNGKLKGGDKLEGQVTVTTEGQGQEYGWEAKKDEAKKK